MCKSVVYCHVHGVNALLFIKLFPLLQKQETSASASDGGNLKAEILRREIQSYVDSFS